MQLEVKHDCAGVIMTIESRLYLVCCHNKHVVTVGYRASAAREVGVDLGFIVPAGLVLGQLEVAETPGVLLHIVLRGPKLALRCHREGISTPVWPPLFIG